MTETNSPHTSRRIPLWVKLIYTAILCVLDPYYWHAYGPTNFLYFCDQALFCTLIALWTEKSLWASMATVGILMPQILWMVDFLAGCVGVRLTGMTDDMFNENLSLFTRGLSFFHFWLPLLLVWIVVRLGYDRRAWAAWTALAWGLLLICYFVMPPPPVPSNNPNQPVNINYVYGMSDQAAQTWMPPLAWLSLLLFGMPMCIFLPTHLALRYLVSPCLAVPPGQTANGLLN